MSMMLTKTNMFGVDAEISKTTVLYEETRREGVQHAYRRYETARIILEPGALSAWRETDTKIGGYPANWILVFV